MKALISRTSDIDGKKKPCKQAFKEDDNWFVEVNTLEELLMLIKQVDSEIIIYDHSVNEPDYEIEIHDEMWFDVTISEI